MYPKTNALPNYSDLTSSNLNNKTFFFHLEHFLVVLSIFEVEAKVRKQADINGRSYFDIYEKTAIIAINKDRSQAAQRLNAICVWNFEQCQVMDITIIVTVYMGTVLLTHQVGRGNRMIR